MDADPPTTVDDLVASVKPTPPPAEDTSKDDEPAAELEPIDSGRLLLFAGPPLVLAAGFGLWLIAWWLPLAALAAAALGVLAWHGKIPGLKGASHGRSGSGKAGWPLGRPRGSSGLLGGGTGRSSGRAGNLLGLGRKTPAGTTGTSGAAKAKPTLRQRVADATKRGRDAARRAGSRTADKARAVVHKATGGRYGKPRATTSSTTGGKGPATSGSPTGGKRGGSGDSGDGKRKRRNPIAALTDLVKGRSSTPDKDPGKPEKPTSKDKRKDKKKKKRDGKDIDGGTGHDADETSTGDTDDEPAHTGPDSTETHKDKPGLLGAYGRVAHKIGDKVRAIDPKAVKATVADALGTPFKGLLKRKPKDPVAEAKDTPPAKPEPDTPKTAPGKTEKPPTTWDDTPPPPSDGEPKPAGRFLDDDPPPVPEATPDVPRQRITWDDTPIPPRHAAYREPRPEPTLDDWTNSGPAQDPGTRAHQPAPTEKTRRSTTMTVVATGAPVVPGSDAYSTPDSRAKYWNDLADGKEADVKVFNGKAEEFQQTIDTLKGEENQTLATEQSIHTAQQAKNEAEEQAQAAQRAAQTFRDKAQEELSQKTN